MIWQVIQRMCSTSLLFLLALSSCRVFLFTDGARVKSVEITPANPTIPVGGKQQFIANVSFNDGVILQVGVTTIIWASSNPAVASIDNSGLATGRTTGNAVITGTFDSVSGSTTLTVTTSAPKVEISGSASKLEVTFLENAQRFLYVANPLDDTISVHRVDIATHEEQPIASLSVEPARGPTWIAVHPSGKFLYAADHVSREISAFLIDPASGRLTTVPGSPFNAEGRPWAVFVDPDGQFLMVTHFESQNVYRFRIDPTSGALTSERSP